MVGFFTVLMFRFIQELEFSWNLVVATIIGFLGSACGTVGGVGGGGIFVPMLTLILGFDTKSAAALSKCIKLKSLIYSSVDLFLVTVPFEELWRGIVGKRGSEKA